MSVPGRLVFVDGLRGIAALWVVAFHLAMSGQIEGIRHWLPGPVFGFVFGAGHLGIWVFFVLSGFVMAMAIENRVIDRAFVGTFLLRRIIRLALPYYVSIAVSIAVLALRAAVHHEPVAWPGIGTLGAHLVFIQEILKLPQLNVVYWTLSIEVQFYLVFAALSWCLYRIAAEPGRSGSRRDGLTPVGFAGLAFISLGWPLGVVVGADWAGGFAPFFYAFLGGVLARAAYRGGAWQRRLLGLYGIVASIASIRTGYAGPLVVALTCSVLVIAPSISQARRLLEWRPLRFCGLVSYSLYLIHEPVILLVGSLVQHLPALGDSRDAASLLLTFGISLSAAFAMWRFVERPAQILGSHMNLGGPALVKG